MFRYLMGEVSESERDDVEDRCLRDNEFFHELVSLENDLIDAYAQGTLSPESQAELQSFLNTPLRRDRLQFARSLNLIKRSSSDFDSKEQAERPKSKPLPPMSVVWRLPNFRLAARIAVIFILVLGLAVSLALNRHLAKELVRVQSQQERATKRSSDLEVEVLKLRAELQRLADQKHALRASEMVSLTLDPQLSRGGGKQQELDLSGSPLLVRLRLLPEPGSSFQCTQCLLSLETAEGRAVWRGTGNVFETSGNHEKEIIVTLSVEILHNADYVLKVTASEGPNNQETAYSFRVRDFNR